MGWYPAMMNPIGRSWQHRDARAGAFGTRWLMRANCYRLHLKISQPSGIRTQSINVTPSISRPNFSSDEICEGSRSGWRSIQRRKTASG